MKKRKLSTLRKAMIFGLCLFFSLFGNTQNHQNIATKRFYLSFSMDIPVSGFAKSVESAMRKSGFGDTSQCFWFCQGSITHPHSSVGPVFNFNLEYKLTRNIQVGTLLGWAEKGQTSGYDKDLNYGAGYFSIKYSIVQLLPHVRFQSNDPRFFAQLGTGLFFISSKSGGSYQSGNSTSKLETKLAANLGAGIYLFDKPRAFMTFYFQYYFVAGEAEIGPFSVPYSYQIGLSEKTFNRQKESVRLYHLGLSYGLKF